MGLSTWNLHSAVGDVSQIFLRECMGVAQFDRIDNFEMNVRYLNPLVDLKELCTPTVLLSVHYTNGMVGFMYKRLSRIESKYVSICLSCTVLFYGDFFFTFISDNKIYYSSAKIMKKDSSKMALYLSTFKCISVCLLLIHANDSG